MNARTELIWFLGFVTVATLFLGYGASFFEQGRWVFGSLEWFVAFGWYFNAYWRWRRYRAAPYIKGGR